MRDFEKMIRDRAYELWEHAGRPSDRRDEFWFAARAEFERKGRTEAKQASGFVQRRVEPPRHESAADWGKSGEMRPPSIALAAWRMARQSAPAIPRRTAYKIMQGRREQCALPRVVAISGI